MREGGTIDRSYMVLASLVRGSVHDRHTIATTFGCTVMSADRYLRALRLVPGVQVKKQGRRLTARWSFSAAILAAGL